MTAGRRRAWTGSRRRLLLWLFLAFAGAIGAVLTLRSSRLGARLRKAYLDRLRGPGLPEDAPAAELAPETLATLLAAAEAIIGAPAGEHYAEFFRWRSASVRGYHPVYQRFRAVVDAAAEREQRCPFALCDAASRKAILARAITEPAAAARRRRAGLRQLALAARPGFERLLERVVIGDALAVFALTDAWVRLGYDGWPGQPRGLDAYRKPLPPPASALDIAKVARA